MYSSLLAEAAASARSVLIPYVHIINKQTLFRHSLNHQPCTCGRGGGDSSTLTAENLSLSIRDLSTEPWQARVTTGPPDYLSALIHSDILSGPQFLLSFCGMLQTLKGPRIACD